MSEAILKRLLRENHLHKKISVESAGIDAPVGRTPTDVIREVCSEHHIDVSQHHSRQLTRTILERATVVFCLAEEHREVLHGAYPEFRAKVVLLKEFGRRPNNLSVEDPIGMPKRAYVACFKEIENQIRRIFPFLEKQMGESSMLTSSS
jgi:protein-tyrosine phosphatase